MRKKQYIKEIVVTTVWYNEISELILSKYELQTKLEIIARIERFFNNCRNVKNSVIPLIEEIQKNLVKLVQKALEHTKKIIRGQNTLTVQKNYENIFKW